MKALLSGTLTVIYRDKDKQEQQKAVNTVKEYARSNFIHLLEIYNNDMWFVAKYDMTKKSKTSGRGYIENMKQTLKKVGKVEITDRKEIMDK